MKQYFSILIAFCLAASGLSAQIMRQAIVNSVAPASGAAAITIKQKVLTQATCLTGSCTTSAFVSNTTATDTILVCGFWTQSSLATNSMTVSGQGTFSNGSSSLVNYGATTNYTNVGGECLYATNITGGVTTGETCTFANATATRSCIAYELTSDVSAALISTGTGTAASTGGNGIAFSSGSVTSTINGAFGLTIVNVDDGFGAAGGAVHTPGTNWTADYDTGGGNQELGDEYWQQSTAGTTTGNGTTTFTGTTQFYAASMIVLEP